MDCSSSSVTFITNELWHHHKWQAGSLAVTCGIITKNLSHHNNRPMALSLLRVLCLRPDYVYHVMEFLTRFKDLYRRTYLTYDADIFGDQLICTSLGQAVREFTVHLLRGRQPLTSRFRCIIRFQLIVQEHWSSCWLLEFWSLHLSCGVFYIERSLPKLINIFSSRKLVSLPNSPVKTNEIGLLER